jgi:outer membrane protein
MNRLIKLTTLSLFTTLLVSTAAMAEDAKSSVKDFSKWQVRLRAIDVIPDESSTLVGIAGKAKADNNVVPELDISYYFTKNISTELILATTKHQAKVVDGTNTTQLGSVWLLPPTLTAQYHFNTDGMIQPYVGAGVNYTWFYDVDKGPGLDRVTYSDGFGEVLQAGVDIMKDEHWGWNFDIKKIFLNTDVSVNNGAITGDVDLDPWVFGTGITYRF